MPDFNHKVKMIKKVNQSTKRQINEKVNCLREISVEQILEENEQRFIRMQIFLIYIITLDNNIIVF